MKKIVIGLAIAMLILHQDSWLWSNTSLVFDFIPVGLFYHACFSIAVAVLAVLAIKFIWPHDLERWATSKTDDAATEVGATKYQIK
jgi:hypothetical protein